MRGRKKLAAAVCIVLIAVFWILGVGSGDVVFPSLEKNGLNFRREGHKSFYLDGGDEYGVLNGGPGFTLPAGRYELSVTVDSDGDNQVRIVTGNGAAAEPSVMTLPTKSWNNTFSFELKEQARDLELLIDFQQGSYLRLHDIDLTMKGVRDGTWMLTLLAAAVCALLLLGEKGVLTRDGFGRLLLIGAAVLVSSVPVLRENLYGGHDTLFHQMRLYNVADALAAGQFPVRMGGYGYNGYGSAASVFYPDVFLYLPALMMCTGATVQCAMRVYIMAMNALSAWTMYACGRRIFESRTAGTCASILYTLASYRLLDIYVRDALGEYTAMAMLPLFVLGLWEVIFGDAKRWRTLTLGAAAVFMSHILSTVLCAALAVLFAVLGAVKIVRERRFTAICKAALATGALCLFVLVPMLDYSLQGIGDSGTFSTPVKDNTLQLMELFVTKAGEAKGLGWALALGAAALVYAAVTGRGEEKKRRNALLLAALGVLFALAATDFMPWAQLERLSRGMVNYLQFPWRLMMFADVFLALGAGYGIACFAGTKAHRELAMLLTLSLGVLCAYPQIEAAAIQNEEPPQHGLHYADPYIRYKSYTDVITGSYLEYALPGSDLKKTRDQRAAVQGEAVVEAYHRQDGVIAMQVSAAQDAKVLLPVFGFDGYCAKLGGEEIAWTRGDNNRLTIDLPAGAKGELRVWFAGKALWRAAEAVSLLTALGMIALGVRRRKCGEAQR